MNRARISPTFGRRFHAVAAAVAVAVMAGLGPAAAKALNPSSPTPAPAAKSAAVTTKASTPAKPVAHVTAKPAAKPVHAAPAKASRAKARTVAVYPAVAKMHPNGIPGGQMTFKPSKTQLKNARSIIQAGQKMHLGPRAWVIAIGTSLQESQLTNLGNLGANNDHDSLGLFQQRPTSGWGTPEEITNPEHSATSFYKGLVQVPGWKHLPLTEAAQAVQVSAYPDHYAKWEKQAGDIVHAFWGNGPYAQQAAHLK
jgi:hypothetical protein